jgi:hypothetical protein
VRVRAGGGERRVVDGRWWLLARTAPVVLWVLVAAGVVFGGLAVLRAPATSTSTAVAAEVVQRWDVAGFAEVFVAAFVSAGEGSEADLAAFLGGPPSVLTGQVAGEWFASRTTTTSVEQLSASRWRVTVAAELLRRDSDAPAAGFSGLGVRFFAVEVHDVAGALVAAGWPSIVAAPAPGAAPEDGWGSGQPPVAGDALADTVQRFLSALLTGTGELDRFAAPGSGLGAAAATFDEVVVERIAVRGDGDARRVRAWAWGRSAEARMWLFYEVSLTRREGRWEVAAIGTPPVVSDPAVGPAATAVPSTTTSQGS